MRTATELVNTSGDAGSGVGESREASIFEQRERRDGSTRVGLAAQSRLHQDRQITSGLPVPHPRPVVGNLAEGGVASTLVVRPQPSAES